MSDDPETCLINDTATIEDSLGFKIYVDAIVNFLTANCTLPPITLSIEGDWGCGKSSFMKQLENSIEKRNISLFQVKMWIFLSYLLSRNRGKDSKELDTLINILTELVVSKNQNLYSFINKLRAIRLYIDSKTKRKKYFTVWFNAWQCEKDEELWASFALNFMDALSKQLPWAYRQYSRIKLLHLRYKLKLKSNFLIFVYFSLNIFFFTFITIFLYAIINYILIYLKISLPYFVDTELIQKSIGVALILAPLVSVVKYFSTEQLFIDIFRDPFGLKRLKSNTNYKERIPFRENFYSDFNKIVESYVGNSRVYVFIDDLDRCEVPIAAELMQAINLMTLNDSKVYFSLGIDRRVISAGIAVKNEKIIDCLGYRNLDYGYEFIEKFIQLPFKVPSSNFRKILDPSYEISSESLPESSSLPGPLTNERENQFNHYTNNNTEGATPNKIEGKERENKKLLINDYDCDEHPEKFIFIKEMVASSLDGNPRRMKQFINLFRFQKYIGYKIGLFDYYEDTNRKYVWNCKKLAKFVAISMKWPSLISALSLEVTLLEQLQEYVLKPENEGKETKENKNLENWIKDKKLVTLLKWGIMEGDDRLKTEAEYSLSGLDYSKLLRISPETASIESLNEIISSMEFVSIPAGEFVMGSSIEEKPLHRVIIKKSFYLGKYPITQKQWIAIMGYNPSQFKGEERPVENVSWNEVQEFIKKINETNITETYRLPSEAEWEYACRAGTTTKYSFGDDESKLGEYAWYSGYANYEEWSNNRDKFLNQGSTHQVGQKKSNPWGLYDMHGNVWEWVQDNWHDDYNGAPVDGSAWENKDNFVRVRRGGCWDSNADYCRSSSRSKNLSEAKFNFLGFRLLKEL